MNNFEYNYSDFHEDPAIATALLMIYKLDDKVIDRVLVDPEAVKEYEKEGYKLSDDQEELNKYFENNQ